MPQDGESPLACLAKAIADEDGFSIGPPASSDGGAVQVLPVHRVRPRSRGYVLVHEVSDEVSAVDPGRIDRVRVRNESAHRVFLPPGTLFAGRETASRATAVGAVVEPGSACDVEVRCVHASRSITPNVPLELADSPAPDSVRRALVSRDQGLVWEAVREFVASRTPTPRDAGNLVEALFASVSPDQAAFASPTLRSPASDTCGAIVLSPAGVEAIEIFDDPGSWNAFAATAIAGSDGASPSARSPLGSVNPDTAIAAAKDFLRNLPDRGQRRLSVCAWTSADASAEWTVLDGAVIHLLAFRGDPWSAHDSAAVRIPGAHTVADDPRATYTLGSAVASDGDVVAEATAVASDDEPEAMGSRERPRRRKVLTSGWDGTTFDSLERYARKEFAGDRSAAMRFLVRQGLSRRGYLGPRPPPAPGAAAPVPAADEGVPRLEPDRAAVETRISDFERIAQTETFAEWLRLRARTELERLASSLDDGILREAARAALERLPPPPPAEPGPEPEEIPPEAIPPTPPVDVRPLLRRAFAASAAGQFSDALRTFDEILEAEPDNRTALLGRAVALRRSGKSQDALEALDLVLRLEPANAAALLNRARVLQERGEFELALETFDRLGAVAPNDWDVWMGRGDVLAKMGRERDALAAYSEALRRNPEDAGLKAKIRAIERARLPPPTSASRVALPREVQEGQSYLVRGGPPDLGYRVFRALSIRSVPTLLITDRDADRVRGEQGLESVRIVEVTTEPGGDRVPPSSLVELTNLIERFLTDNRGRGAVLLEGLSLLLQTNGFRDTALFLARVNETIQPSQAVFLVSAARGELGEKEAAILERDLRVLS